MAIQGEGLWATCGFAGESDLEELIVILWVLIERCGLNTPELEIDRNPSGGGTVRIKLARAQALVPFVVASHRQTRYCREAAVPAGRGGTGVRSWKARPDKERKEQDGAEIPRGMFPRVATGYAVDGNNSGVGLQDSRMTIDGTQ